MIDLDLEDERRELECMIAERMERGIVETQHKLVAALEEIERLRDMLGMPGKPVSAVIADLCRDDPEFAARYQAAAREAQRSQRFVRCHFSGPSPDGFNNWYDWMQSPVLTGAHICSASYTPPPSVPDELIKMVATTFFRYWYNAPGSNTDQGFDDWWSDNREAMLNAAKQEGEQCEHGKGMTDYCEPCGRIHNA